MVSRFGWGYLSLCGYSDTQSQSQSPGPSLPFGVSFYTFVTDSMLSVCSLTVSPPPFLIAPLPSHSFYWAVFINTSTDGRRIAYEPERERRFASAVVQKYLSASPRNSACTGNHQGSRCAFIGPLPQSQGAHSRGCRPTPLDTAALALDWIDWALERSSEFTKNESTGQQRKTLTVK